MASNWRHAMLGLPENVENKGLDGIELTVMERLAKEADKKALLIVDSLKVHHGKIVTEWLSEHKKEIELFFTLPYSPEINPDEYLNHNLKQNIHSGIIPHTREEIQICNKTEKFMQGLQEQREK